MKKRKESTKPKWQDSIGKQLLIKDLDQGRISLDGQPGDYKIIYKMHEEFGGADAEEFKKFPARLRSARNQVKQSMQRASVDSSALAHDRSIYPISAFDQRNRPRWDGSSAQTLLRIDVNENRQAEKKKRPNELYQLREEYQIFSPRVFRDHVYQEEKRQKAINQFVIRPEKWVLLCDFILYSKSISVL